MYRSWKNQLRVLTALTIREIQAQNSSLDYGYAWALIDVLISLGAITVLKVFIRALSPQGMPPILFLVTGILPWLTFSSTAQAVEGSIKRNMRLLGLPSVTPLDLVFAKSLQILCTYGSVFFVVAIAVSYLEHAGMPRSVPGVILIYIYSWVLGIAYGLCTMPLTRVYPPAAKALGVIWRFGLLMSGVFFVITMFPEWSWVYLAWNPMIHVEELMRTYWFSAYQTPIGSPTYLAEALGTLTILGLSLERYIRRRVPA